MNRDSVPGYLPLIDRLLSFCYTRVNFTLYSDNVMDEFYARRAENIVYFGGLEIKIPTIESDEEIKQHLYDRVVTLPYVLIFTESLTNKIDPISCKQIIEYRGFVVEYKENTINYKQLPKEDVLIRNIDLKTGQIIEPDTNEIYF